MTNKIGPNELGKHPEIIKKAQQELLKMDILVCGGCHAIFHYVNGFEDHKENCKGPGNQPKTDLKNSWGYALWKSSQGAALLQNPWKLYQNWVQLDSKQQAAWIMAGQSIQTISRIGHGAVQETQVKVVRTVTGPVKLADPDTKTDQDSESNLKADKNQKIDISKPMATAGKRYLVKRTMNSTASHIELRECLAEKVTSRRFNGKRNTFEYNVKWVDHEDTWEPAAHFEKSAHELVADCDRKLAKQKSAAAAAAAVAGGANVAAVTSSPAAVVNSGRPERSSKARAVNTLRSWCNTEDKSGAASGELKRKNTDSDYAEGDSSQDESMGASPSPKKLLKTPTQAGQKVSPLVRPYQKPVNGTPVTVPSAEVVIDKLGDKASGVRRKPGAVASPVVKREAQVKVIGKNDSTSSGIVRVGKSPIAAGGTSPLGSAAPGSRVQKVLQTTRTPSGQTVQRMVYRTVPAKSPGTPSPVAKTAMTRTVPGTNAVGTRSATQPTYQMNKTGVTRQVGSPATVPNKVSPTNVRVRTPIAKPLKPAITPPGRVLRASPTVSPVAKTTANSIASDASTTSGDGADMVLCPVTGKLVSKAEAEASAGEEADSELQRLLTNEEEAVMQAAAAAAAEGATEEAGVVGNTQIAELIQNEDGSPVMVTGEDGTVYQVAGKNSEGQTLLFTQGEEGEQQCVIMATPDEAATGSDGGLVGEEVGAGGAGEVTQAMMVDGDSQDGQITAELVQADEPSADGTRRVVLLLPGGNLMVSELNEEQYQQFNLGS